VTLTEPDADAISISDAARAIGVTTHTLRYYERAGLMLDRVPRATSSHRRYRAEDVSWVVFLTRLRATGMPIRVLRQYADLVRAGGGNELTRLELLERHRARVVEQLTQMQRHLEAIDFKIDIYRSSGCST